MRILSVVGARPQFVKAAVVSRALAQVGAQEILVHTGQHYDRGMSALFFEQLGIPAPDTNLEVGSGSHATQTAAMMTGLETLVKAERPDWVLVYGDTNSTLAAALVAAKEHVQLAHVEAGLRSFNRRMPEEINRIVTDDLSDLLFCPTSTAVENLRKEGQTLGVELVGDVMLDATEHFAEQANAVAPLDALTTHSAGAYNLATVHRAENTDDPARLQAIFEALGRVSRPVVLPLHPRTRSRLEGISVPDAVEVVEPVGYLAMLTLVRNAHRVLTDSGGLQKEAVWLGTPCVTLRNETEWVETCEGGWNRVVGANLDAIVAAEGASPEGPSPRSGRVGDRTASERIAGAFG